MISRVDTEILGNRDQEPWQAAQAAQVAATIAAVANDPDPNAVGRALGYDMGGGGLVGLAGTVAGALVDVSKFATPVVGVVAPELLPVVAGITAGAKLMQAGARATQAGGGSPLDVVGAATAARAALSSQADGNGPPRNADGGGGVHVPIAVDRFYAAAPGRSAPSPLRDRASLEAALAAMPPARARAALALLLLLRQQGRI